MRTSILIGEALIEEAMQLTGARTKREVVNLALRTLIDECRRLDLRELRGKARITPGYNPQSRRSR